MTPRLTALLDWYATLTPASLQCIDSFYAADCHFRDPFNDVYGLPATKALFEHMFAVSHAPQFSIERHFSEGESAAVFWRFDCHLGRRAVAFTGMSALRFNTAGLVVEHIDYWDSADLYAHFPLLKCAVAWLRRRLQAPPC